MAENLVLVAASGLAREVITCLARSEEYRVTGIVDDDPALKGRSVLGVEIIGDVDAAASMTGVRLLVCAGQGQSRRKIVERLASKGVPAERYATVLDPTAIVPTSCVVGTGSVILGYVVLTADISLGRHVVVMPHVTLTHDDAIGDFVTLCAGVSLGGSVHVGDMAYIGMNSSVREGLRVGAESTVGMGAVVLKDVGYQSTVVGNPARQLTSRRQERPLETAVPQRQLRREAAS